MTLSFDRAVGEQFFPTMKAPITWIEYLEHDYILNKAKSIFTGLYEASQDACDINPVDVPCTWALMCVLRPLFERTTTLTNYPMGCDVPAMMDGLDIVCATYGMRQLYNMIRAVSAVQNDFSIWQQHLERLLERPRSVFTVGHSMSREICAQVQHTCVVVRQRLFYAESLITMHATDLHAVAYREKRGTREYELGTSLYLEAPIWELKPVDGVGPTLAFLCVELFTTSDGGNQALPLLPP